MNEIERKSIVSTRRKRTSERSDCQICGSFAIYSYFGAISCEACKIFFKRYALFGKNYFRCIYNNECIVNASTRRLCSACRLKKCFEKGMKSEMIRSFVNRKNRSTSNQFGKLPTLNLLDQDNSLLHCTQWTLLSNLIHNYQDSKSFSISQRIRNEIDSFQFINQSSLHDFLMSFYEITGNSLRSNADITRLQSDDRSILLHIAATNATCMSAEFILYHSQLLSSELFWYYLEPIYGKPAVYYSKWSSKFIDPDPVISKLSIALFTLSTNGRIYCRNIEIEYTNINEILNIENRYTEILWKYLLYKYGYVQTIHRYVHIIDWFLALTVFIQSVHNVDVHVNDVESLVEQTEIALLLDDVDRIVDNKI